MSDIWRYVCGRCGSVAVTRQSRDAFNGPHAGQGWRCGGRATGHNATPAVFDLREREWLHDVTANDPDADGRVVRRTGAERRADAESEQQEVPKP